MRNYSTDSKAFRPSKFGDAGRIREAKSSNHNGKYKFSKPVYRIAYENQIKLLFDNPDEVKVNGRQYRGKIDGIEARIDFSLNHPCLLKAETEAELIKAHEKILYYLSMRNRKN